MERIATETARGHLKRPAAAARRRRGAFTLIEMLIAIGIILLLMTIGVLGYRAMERSNTERTTKLALVNAESLTKEMNSIGALALIEGPADAAQPPVYATGTSIACPSKVSVGGVDRDKVVVQTQKVMRVLRSNPKNKTAMQNMPSNLIMPQPPTPPPGYDQTVPVLVDAWGGPLMYVPSGGLIGVNFAGSGAANQRVTSSGQPTSLQNRGFWASAGPDGDFTAGDDNVYSFQQ